MSRFEDTLHRDFSVIADRATPSPDAWGSILTRIVDQEPTQETEIIMLTDNTMPTRRWPLVAAAAAVIALAVGAIVTIGTGGADDVPAEPVDPVPTVPPPADDIETDATPQLVSASGTATGVSEFSELDATGAGTYTGTTSFEGDLTGLGTETGTYTMSADGNSSEATATISVDGTIAGVGSGTLAIDVAWSSSRATGLDWSGTVVAGTGDFAGATGTLTIVDGGNVDDPATASVEVSGTYTLELEFGDTPDDVGTDAPNTADGWSSLDPSSELAVGLSPRTLHPFEYWSDALGVPIAFANPTAVQLGAVDPGSIWLTSTGASAEVQGVVLSRVGSWFTPEEAIDPAFEGPGSIERTAVDEWIELHGFVVDESSDAEVSGRAADVRAFTVSADHASVFADPSLCPWPEAQPCFRAESASAEVDDPAAVDHRVMTAGWSYRLWLVELEGFEPLMVRVYGDPGDPSTPEWLDDIVPSMVETIELGAPTSVLRTVAADGDLMPNGTTQAR